MGISKGTYAALLILAFSLNVIAHLDEQANSRQLKAKGSSLRLNQEGNSVFSFDASPNVRVDVLRKIKRDMLFFVEGFSFISNNVILESTGLENQTEVHYVDLDDMSIKNSYTFDGDIFGEGSVMIKDKKTNSNVVFMMTYQNKIVYKMDEKLTSIIETFEMPKEMREGWGMSKLDEDTIIATDGSNQLFHIDPSNFTVKKIVKVNNSKGYPVNSLNELEVIDGKIYANIFLSKKIVVFDPHSGALQDVLDFNPLSRMLEDEDGYRGYTTGINSNNVLNGIAYNPETKQTLITGKNWPYVYEIKLVNKN